MRKFDENRRARNKAEQSGNASEYTLRAIKMKVCIGGGGRRREAKTPVTTACPDSR